MPTIQTEDTFLAALATWLANKPFEIIIVTVPTNEALIRKRLATALVGLDVGMTTTTVLTVAFARKRQQLACGIQKARGAILVLADDDVFWPSTLLPLVLACFEDPKTGGVGTRQRSSLPADKATTVWEYVAICHFERRNRDCSASNYLDRSVTCLSGRTAAYRVSILKETSFLHAFTHDYWLGRYLLDSGDDTFITRWLLLKNWHIRIQAHPGAEIETSVKQRGIFLRQLLRWARNTNRSFLRFVFFSPSLWRLVGNRKY